MKGGIVLVSFIAIALAKKFRWCNISDMEQRKCAEFTNALQAVLTPRARNSLTKLSCIRAHNVEDCIKKIRVAEVTQWQDSLSTPIPPRGITEGNVADAVSLDATDAYTAVTFYGLTIVAKEMYPDGGCLYSVAVTQDQSLDIRQLRGKRSCHDGARRTAGWNIPLGFLLSHRYLHWRENQSVAEAVSGFFSASCAPGASASFPNLCALCRGQKSYNKARNYFCETTDNEPYYGSEGALRCLEQGTSDVAFLDNSALASMSVSEAAKYRLLCANGTQANVTDGRKCHLGRGPGNTVVTRYNARKSTRKFLALAQYLFGLNGKRRRLFQLFSSDGFNRKNLMFRDATVKLMLLADNTDISQVLGLDYISLLKALGHQGSSLENNIVRWCCISSAEQRKCEDWALNTKSTLLVCIRATSASHCIEMIKRDEVDAASFDATHAYIAGKCGLVPVVTEHYVLCQGYIVTKNTLTYQRVWQQGPPPVYAVSVVKKASRGENLLNLAGRRSCHSHMYSPAGWLLLAKFTVRSHNDTDTCNINEAYANYFRKACMPGSRRMGKLCKVCIGREQAGSKIPGLRCAANHDELYYGNMGALRCLVGNANQKNFGDVAFLEHHNLMENIEALGRSGWATGWTSDDFELLCPGGDRAPLAAWDSCNLGAIPPNIVMTRSVIATKTRDLLMNSQERFGPSSLSEFQLFQSKNYKESDLLFKDATRSLSRAAHLNYTDVLGEAFVSLAESAFSCTHSATQKQAVSLQKSKHTVVSRNPIEQTSVSFSQHLKVTDHREMNPKEPSRSPRIEPSRPKSQPKR